MKTENKTILLLYPTLSVSMSFLGDCFEISGFSNTGRTLDLWAVVMVLIWIFYVLLDKKENISPPFVKKC